MRLKDQPLSPPAQVLATAITCSRAPKASSPRLKGLLRDLAMGGTQNDEHEHQLAQVSQVLKSAAFEVDTRLREEMSPPCSAGMPSR